MKVLGTGAEEFQFPLMINSSITLIDIAEFDENKNTITLQVVLSIRWHAATMELESNNDKYVYSVQLVNKQNGRYILLILILEYLDGISLIKMIKHRSGVLLYKSTKLKQFKEQ